MGNPDNVKIGACNVTFNSVDLGYTKGNVSCEYNTESTEIEVDQEDAPIDELITKQNFIVTVPLAETQLSRLASLIPGATLMQSGTDYKLVLSGGATGTMAAMAQKLVITPVDGSEDGKVTLQKAAPIPGFSFAYEKQNVRVYEVKFKALVDDTLGWVVLGKESITTAIPVIATCTPDNGPVGTVVMLKGINFTGTTGITVDAQTVTVFSVIDPTTIVLQIPSGVSGAANIVVTNAAGPGTLTNGFTQS